MSASFNVRNSTIELNGVDISGLSNTLEVTISTGLTKNRNAHRIGKLSTSVRQKTFFKQSEFESFCEVCNKRETKSYVFNREGLQYTMQDVSIILSKESPIAGVVPVELVISSSEVPSRKRFNGSLERT